MRIPAVALLVIIGLPPCSGVEHANGPTGSFAVDNGSKVDVAFELTAAGKRVPGCFWVLRGQSVTFELPRGKLAWSYSVAGTHFTGETEVAPGLPKLVRCTTGQARLGGDVAECEPAVAPDKLPPSSATAALGSATLGFLEEVAQRLQRGDELALAELIEPPFDVKWAGESPGTRRVKSARHLLELRSELALDPKALTAAKARGGDPRTGEDDCNKHEVDWSKGEPALSCEGHEVTVALRPSAACDASQRVDTWTLRNSGGGWLLVGKGVRTPSTPH